MTYQYHKTSHFKLLILIPLKLIKYSLVAAVIQITHVTIAFRKQNQKFHSVKTIYFHRSLQRCPKVWSSSWNHFSRPYWALIEQSRYVKLNIINHILFAKTHRGTNVGQVKNNTSLTPRLISADLKKYDIIKFILNYRKNILILCYDTSSHPVLKLWKEIKSFTREVIHQPHQNSRSATDHSEKIITEIWNTDWQNVTIALLKQNQNFHSVKTIYFHRSLQRCPKVWSSSWNLNHLHRPYEI